MPILQRFSTVVTPFSKPGVLPLAAAAMSLALACASAVGAERPRRLVYNCDGDNIFIYKETPMRPADVYAYVDEVAGTGVTSFFMCPNIGMAMNYPSRVAQMLGTEVSPAQAATFKKGVPTRRASLARAAANLHSLVEAGHDPLGLVIDRAREKQLEVFITFRLNEIHAVEQPDSMLLSQFWRDHPAWRVGKTGDAISDVFKEIIGGTPKHRVHPIVASWFPGALNFAVPEVRARRLAELRDCCERYPIDGLDLDFQRFPIYFPQDEGHKHVETMTAWMREVRAMTRDVGRKRGRPLLLSARVLARPRQCLAIGLDPVTWAKEGLIDFVVISHYLRNDFPLPVAEYRKRLPPTLPLYASIEVESKPDTYRRIARRLWADGADGIELFNFFTPRQNGKALPFELLNELGDPTKIRSVQ